MVIAEREEDDRYVGLVELTVQEPTPARQPIRPPEDFYDLMKWLGVPQAESVISIEFARDLATKGKNHDDRPGYHTWMPTIVRFPDRVVIWAITLRKPVHKHAVIGMWYGYPQCCIKEHLFDIEHYRRSGFTDNPIAKKRKENHPYRGGPVPCNACLTDPYPDFKEQVKRHRQCPIPYPTAVPGKTWFGAVLCYGRGELKPWGRR
jgi:hypothetical protein